jgi:hypothetical protein
MIHGAQSYDETVKGLGRQMWFNAPYKVREEHLKHWANPNQAAEELLSYFSEILLDDVRKSSLDPKWFDIVENVYRNPDLTIMDILKDIPR